MSHATNPEITKYTVPSFNTRVEKNYLTERKGTIFVFRSIFFTTIEGGGVMLVPDPLFNGQSENYKVMFPSKF